MKLKPCPFCGREMIEIDIHIKYWGIFFPEKLYYVHCSYCGGKASRRDTKQEAVECWNRRNKK